MLQKRKEKKKKENTISSCYSADCRSVCNLNMPMSALNPRRVSSFFLSFVYKATGQQDLNIGLFKTIRQWDLDNLKEEEEKLLLLPKL